MEQEKYRKACMDLVYLAGCAAMEKVPDLERIRGMDLEAVYQASRRHLLTAAAAMALEKAGVRNHAFAEAEARAIRKNALLDADRIAVLERLDQEGIRYLPLKGAVLQKMYPRYGMRQMADNDILFDADRDQDVRRIMEGQGFTTEHFGPKNNHDVYHKEPVSNFEMHRRLFSPTGDLKVHEYFERTWDRAIPDEGKRCGYHLSTEDCYIYIIAHERKHYEGSGTGLRSLLDTWVYLKKTDMDWDYVLQELQKVGLTEFEMMNRSLSQDLFEEKPLSEKEQEMLDYVISSGTYGTLEHRVSRSLKGSGKGKYLLGRIFMPLGTLKNLFPILEKAPFLYPVFLIVRFVRAMMKRGSKILAEFRMVCRYRKSEEK